MILIFWFYFKRYNIVLWNIILDFLNYYRCLKIIYYFNFIIFMFSLRWFFIFLVKRLVIKENFVYYR